jgi:hypothetical protein
MNPGTPIDDAYVLAAARAAGLDIAPAQVAGVTANLARIEAIARPLNAFALEAGDEIAPVWTP